MNILCTGSIAFDYLMSFPGYFKDHILPDRLESISLSFLVDTMVRQRGGTAPNIAYTLALLGERPRILATVGEDFSEYGSWLESMGVNTCCIHTVPGKYTASFFANTDLGNSQIASFYTGAMADAANLSLRDVPEPAIDLLIISPNDPAAMRKYTEEAIELGIPYLYDPGQQLARVAHEDICRGVECAQSLFVNEYEFELLLKHTGLTKEDILERVEFMVITAGNQGAHVYAGGQVYDIDCVPPRQMADPTGVGDAFRGGFLTGYRLKMDWLTCGRMGALAATYCLENRGTLNHFYTPAEFAGRYEELFGKTPELDALRAQPVRQKPGEEA